MNQAVNQKMALIGLGANLGNRSQNLANAILTLHHHARIKVIAISERYQTKAHTLNPEDVAPDYINAAIKVKTTLSAEELLQFCLATEKSAGRHRKNIPQWAPRTLDLDILWFDNLSINQIDLILPHPRLHLRKFVLLPLFDIAKNQVIDNDQTVSDLLEKCPDLDMPKVVSDKVTLKTWPPILS